MMDEDDVIAISNYLLHGVYPEGFTRDDKRSLRQKSSSFVCEADESGVPRLYHRGKHDKRQLVIYDPDEKLEILRAAHSDVSGPGSGRPSTVVGGVPHSGINTTLRKITERYWWRRLVEDVRSYCKNCPGCCHINSAVPMNAITPFCDASQVEEKFVDVSGVDALSDGQLPMTDITNCVLRRSSTYPHNLLTALSELRSQNRFCDVTLTSDDGTFQTKVHKIVLLAASGYLKSLLLDPDLIFHDHITVPNVSGSCLENIVSFLYSGVLHLSPDTVDIMLVVATQLEISSLIDLCENFIANPHHSHPSGEKEQVECNSEDNAKNLSVHEISCSHKPAVKLEKENRMDSSTTSLLIRPSAAPTMRTTRSWTRKLRESESTKASQVVKLSSKASGREKTGCIKRRSTVLETIVKSSETKRLDTGIDSDPDWKPAMDGCFHNAIHRYNTRKHSMSDKSVLSSDLAIQNVRQKHSFSSSPATHLARKCAVSDMRTPSRSVYRLPAWRQARKVLLVARVFLAKRAKVSDDGLLHCRQCQVEASTSRSRLLAHVLCQHRRWLFCFLCRQRFSTFLALVRHRYHKHHYAGSPVRKKDSVSLGSSLSTARHLHNKCGWCGLKFAARSKLIEHREAVHRKRADSSLPRTCRRVVRDWSCSEKDCGMKFKQKDKLRLHMAEQHPTVVFSCPECRFKTQIEHILRRHLIRHHRECHSCHVCGKAYHKPFLLRVHMFNRHKLKDPSLKLYHCSHEGCDYACPSKNGINLHLLKHAEPDAFACEVCGKTFKRQAGLDKHVSKIHLGIRPFICDKCGISYSDEAELRMHIARHAESKPYSCNFCSYSTFQKGSLKSHLFCRHQVLMDSEMPVLRCDFCSFVTEKRCRFDDHVKMHHNIRDIPCNHCGKLFVTKKTLRQHVIKVHRRSAAVTSAASPTTVPTLLTGCPIAIPAQVQKLNDELLSADGVPAAETDTASPELISASDVIDNFNPSSFQSPSGTGYDQITVQSSIVPVEYQMLMPLPSAAVADGTPSLTQVAAVSGAHPIIVGISLPTIDNMTTYQSFQPFDLQNARLVL